MNLQEPEDRSNTVRLSGRRFEESPFISRYDGPELIRGVYAGRYFPIFNGEDPVRNYWVLRRKALLFDTPEKPVEVSGPDAPAFLDKVFSRSVSTLEEGRGRYALACTPQGGVFMDGVVFRIEGDRFWYVQADGALEDWLLAHSGGCDVTISDPKSRVIQIQGPASLEIMRAASANRIDEGMRYFRAGFFDLGGQEVYVSRTGFTGELGYEIYPLGNATDHLALWDHLMAAGEPHGMEFSSTSPMTMRRIEAGILGNTTDMDTTMTPFEAGLGRFVDMERGDFVGRAALLHADRRPLLHGLTCSDALPSAASTVLDGDTPVGRMTMGVRSPTLERGIGYVRFNEPGDWKGRSLRIRLPSGDVHPCEIVDLPFVDPEKRIVRGLDRSIP
ncbi:MAG: aminomethyl transferase family protein [Chloroflexi bacterium]|nr:aminomethyl transferase family protein [Chloroflexota bacterium]